MRCRRVSAVVMSVATSPSSSHVETSRMSSSPPPPQKASLQYVRRKSKPITHIWIHGPALAHCPHARELYPGGLPILPELDDSYRHSWHMPLVQQRTSEFLKVRAQQCRWRSSRVGRWGGEGRLQRGHRDRERKQESNSGMHLDASAEQMMAKGGAATAWCRSLCVRLRPSARGLAYPARAG